MCLADSLFYARDRDEICRTQTGVEAQSNPRSVLLTSIGLHGIAFADGLHIWQKRLLAATLRSLESMVGFASPVTEQIGIVDLFFQCRVATKSCGEGLRRSLARRILTSENRGKVPT